MQLQPKGTGGVSEVSGSNSKKTGTLFYFRFGKKRVLKNRIFKELLGFSMELTFSVNVYLILILRSNYFDFLRELSLRTCNPWSTGTESFVKKKMVEKQGFIPTETPDCCWPF